MPQTRYKMGVISRDEAMRLAPDYVKAVEGDFRVLMDKVMPIFVAMKRGQAALTYLDGQFIKVKVTSVTNDWRNEDGPVIRVGNGEATWRVDGNKYAYPIQD